MNVVAMGTSAVPQISRPCKKPSPKPRRGVTMRNPTRKRGVAHPRETRASLTGPYILFGSICQNHKPHKIKQTLFYPIFAT